VEDLTVGGEDEFSGEGVFVLLHGALARLYREFTKITE
jgi:hypothetical protein